MEQGGSAAVDSSRWLLEHLLQAETIDRAMRSISHQPALQCGQGQANGCAMGRCVVKQRAAGHHLLADGAVLRGKDGGVCGGAKRWGRMGCCSAGCLE